MSNNAFLEMALRDPGRVFQERPDLVLQKSDLSKEDKILILRSWLLDMQLEEVAQEENMQGLKKDIVDQLKKALRTLIKPDPDHGQPTKFSGM